MFAPARWRSKHHLRWRRLDSWNRARQAPHLSKPAEETDMSLTDYVTLGRSGLRVSPLSLGTMTFGTEWGWGSDEPQAREIFDRYTDQGGNFVDTANGYTQGKSEQMVGKFIADKNISRAIAVLPNIT